jgi:hypothetical protein
VGCGFGTKILLAEAMFGLNAWGIDIVPAFVAASQQAGAQATVCDAFEYTGYGDFGIVFVNRPSTLQDELEKLVCERMSSQSVLMAANWRHDPAEFGFRAVDIEWTGNEGPKCGVWRKP